MFVCFYVGGFRDAVVNDTARVGQSPNPGITRAALRRERGRRIHHNLTAAFRQSLQNLLSVTSAALRRVQDPLGGAHKQ